jgi:hypothetical protein
VEPEDLHCDLCGAPADTLHFVPWVTRCEQVIFACPAHCPVPEGYWVELRRWFGKNDIDWREHITEKQNGWKALCVLDARFWNIQIALAQGGDEL